MTKALSILVFFLASSFDPIIAQTLANDSLLQSTIVHFEYPADFFSKTFAPNKGGDQVRVNVILDSIIQQNRKIKFIEGYRILVYAGSSKEEANVVKEKLYQLVPNENIYLQYKQPAYRVKMGDYENRLEAVRKFSKAISSNFPKAIVVNDAVIVSRPK